MSIRSSIDHEKYIFLFFLHQVGFPCKFFNFGRIGKQFLRKNGVFFDLFQVEMFFLLQRVQLFPVFHPVQDAAAVEEYHPHTKDDQGYSILIDE